MKERPPLEQAMYDRMSDDDKLLVLDYEEDVPAALADGRCTKIQGAGCGLPVALADQEDRIAELEKLAGEPLPDGVLEALIDTYTHTAICPTCALGHMIEARRHVEQALRMRRMGGFN